MNAAYNLSINPFTLILYLVPFLITIIIPGLFLPGIVSRFLINHGKSTRFNFLPFSVSLIVLSILAILFWEFGLFNKVYYVWDRFFLPYNPFFFEVPVLNSSNNWLAPGWTLWHLYIIWLLITFCIYIATIWVCFRFSRKYKESNLYRKIILISILPFILLTLMASIFIFSRINYNITTYQPQVTELGNFPIYLNAILLSKTPHQTGDIEIGDTSCRENCPPITVNCATVSDPSSPCNNDGYNFKVRDSFKKVFEWYEERCGKGGAGSIEPDKSSGGTIKVCSKNNIDYLLSIDGNPKNTSFSVWVPIKK